MTGRPDQLPLADTTPAEGQLAVRVTCRRCHRPLHDPLSRELRYGPECRGAAQRVERYDVAQDALPGM